MSLSRRARKQLIAFAVLVALVLIVGIGGNQLRLMRRAASAADGLQRGTAAFEAGDYEEAIDQLNRYVPRNRGDADALYMLAKSRLEVPLDGGGHYATALSFARGASDLAPDDVEKRLLVLEILTRSSAGSLTDLLSAIDAVLGLDPNRTDLRVIKANVLRTNDRSDDALSELRAIVSRDPSSVEALSGISSLLIDRPAEYSRWVTELDQQAADNPDEAAFDIARIDARLRLLYAEASSGGVSAIAASRALTAYDILTESLLPRTIDNPQKFRLALTKVDEVDRVIRLTRPRSGDNEQATQDRLVAIDESAARFVELHTERPGESPARSLGAMEWLWTSDRPELLSELARRWGETGRVQPDSSVGLAIEALISITNSLPPDERSDLPEAGPDAVGRLWIRLAEAAAALRDNDPTEAERLIEASIESAGVVQSSLLFSSGPPNDRAEQAFIASLAGPALSLLRAEAASVSGDTARAITFWTDAADARPGWDLPALQLLATFRERGNIARAEEWTERALLRGATLETGLTMIESTVDQYALGRCHVSDNHLITFCVSAQMCLIGKARGSWCDNMINGLSQTRYGHICFNSTLRI